jgi:hypothetical protein
VSNAVKAVIGVVLIIVAPEAAPWLTPILFSAGASLLLNAAASLFIKAPRATPLAGVAINYAGTLEARRLICGAPYSTGSDSKDCMDQVFAAVDREGEERAT